MQAIRFTNFSDEDFVGVWSKIEYPIKAGETMMFEDFKAKHFAKHLIDRELNKKEIPTNRMLDRMKMEKMCLGGILAEAETASELESKMLNVKEEKVVGEGEDLNKYNFKALQKMAKGLGIEVDNYKNKKELIAGILENQGLEKPEEEEEAEEVNEEEEFEDK
jgi:hypothetical protein